MSPECYRGDEGYPVYGLGFKDPSRVVRIPNKNQHCFSSNSVPSNVTNLRDPWNRRARVGDGGLQYGF